MHAFTDQFRNLCTQFAVLVETLLQRGGRRRKLVFDSADAKKDQPTMQMLSNCMIDGPLRGKTIKLIGHTDPRGSVGYNDKLGLERAEKVTEASV